MKSEQGKFAEADQLLRANIDIRRTKEDPESGPSDVPLFVAAQRLVLSRSRRFHRLCGKCGLS